jgi:adenylate cyclase
VFRDGDYFGGDVNLAHRVVTRALGGEVLITQPVMELVGDSAYLKFDAIGEVTLKGIDEPIHLHVARAAIS